MPGTGLATTGFGGSGRCGITERKFMKTLKRTILALVLGICPAGAITLSVHHDTQKKLDFTIDWHDVSSFQQEGNFSVGHASVGEWAEYSLWGGSYIEFEIFAISPLFHDPPLFFPQRGELGLFYQPYPSNYLGIISIDEGPFFDPVSDGSQIKHPYMKIAQDAQSARWTFHEKDFLPVSVPDGGSTLMLLGMALSLVGAARRGMR